MSDEAVEEEDVNGALIRGADGRMFFIPEEDLEGFQLEDGEAAMVRELLDEAQNEVAGFNFDPQVLSADMKVLPTIQGPIGRRAIDPGARMEPVDWALCNGNNSFFKGIG